MLYMIFYNQIRLKKKRSSCCCTQKDKYLLSLFLNMNTSRCPQVNWKAQPPLFKRHSLMLACSCWLVLVCYCWILEGAQHLLCTSSPTPGGKASKENENNVEALAPLAACFAGPK